MIIIEKELVNDIPILHVAQQEQSNETLPLIIFHHGFTSAKEHNLHYAYLMAEKGFRVVLPDALLHGEREKDFSESRLMMHFWEIVIRSINDLEVIKEEFLSRKLADSSKIGVAGTSMGGIITLGALATHDWIAAAVSLMGNPAYVAYARQQIEALKKFNVNVSLTEKEIERQLDYISEYDLSMQREKLAGRPLLFWHGAKDPIVPSTGAQDFYELIKPDYEQYKDKLSFILDQGAGHKVSREGVLQTAEWFDRHLKQMQNA
ncbi:prolyl oligopeptidase family serine peptidase [Peribacillus sp. SCS-155]|uniref:prolyl oligopeptidase family serine peptidase n=1 Tax=Peribacillus sedimenti TaxID=3115297 RepID=UPI003905ADF6